MTALIPSHEELLDAYKANDVHTAYDGWVLRADDGDVQAMINLGIINVQGELGEKRYEEGAKWFEKTLKYGSSIGMYNLGILYEHGLGCEKDSDKARDFYLQAKREGHIGAAFHVAMLCVADPEYIKEGFDALIMAAHGGMMQAKNRIIGYEESKDTKPNLDANIPITIKEDITDFVEKELTPVLKSDGGGITLIDIILPDLGLVELRMKFEGNCSGCALAATGTYRMIGDMFNRRFGIPAKIYIL